MDLLDVLEATLKLINTRPLGRRPDALERPSNISPRLLELIPRQNATSSVDVRTSESVTEVRQLRDAFALAVLAESPTEAHRALQQLRDVSPAKTTPDGASGSLAAELAQALIPLLQQAIAEGAMEWVQTCPDRACQTVFLNRARTRRRRYCSRRCGTRARMVRHRQRHSE